MKDFLERLENGLRNIVERTLERLAGGKLDAPAVAAHLVRAMESSLRRDRAGRLWAADEFDLRMNPADLEALLEEVPDLKALLKQALLQAARDSGYAIAEEPRIAIEVDTQAPRNKVRVMPFHSQSMPDHTRQMPSLASAAGEAPGKASLVDIQGNIHALDREVFSIGRLPDNQIVFRDPRVSRRHAQVRLRQGQHVIFDMGSRAGTRVNGEPTMERVLRHGDVLTFAGNRLVYRYGDASPTSGEEPGASG
jgi:hypothetical protein